jgi:hypothetical protein
MGKEDARWKQCATVLYSLLCVQSALVQGML